MSAPVNNRLVYTTPAISTLFAGGMSLDSFESLDKVEMNLSVKTTVYAEQLTCAEGADSSCKVTYDWDYTPIIYYLIPSIVYPGMTATVGLNPRKAT